MKKITIVLSAIAVFMIAAGLVFVFAKDAKVFDVFFAEKARAQRALDRQAKLYPAKIGEYEIYSRAIQKVQKNDERCQNFMGSEICMINTIGEYRDGDKVVFIHISKITKGDVAYEKYLADTIVPGKFRGFGVIKDGSNEIFWLSKGYFLGAQDGIVKQIPGGGESMDYRVEMEKEGNPVIEYFIAKFPPEKLPK